MMPKINPVIVAFLMISVTISCSKKNVPVRSNSVIITKDGISPSVKKATPNSKLAIPKVIVVNDNVAHKSVDGRYYYDLLGHRYWRSNKDGKYYLFNKSMYTDNAFKKVN